MPQCVNNMLANIKISKTQIYKVIPLGGFFRSWLSTLVIKALTNIAITS